MGKLSWLSVCRLLVASVGCVTAVAIGSVDQHYNANGVVCIKCPPGTRVLEHCTTNFGNSSCQACPDHQYVDHFNSEKHCKACKLSCPKNSLEAQTCTATTNRLCLCVNGYHRYPLDPYDDHYKCKTHTPCQPGHGVKDYGNHTHDIVCEECQDGQHFVNMSDLDHPRCEECSVCANDSYVLSNCTALSDTVCSQNSSQIGTTPETPHHNDSDGLPGGGVAAIVIVCLLVVGILVVGIVWYRRRSLTKTKTKADQEKENPNKPEAKAENGTDSFPLLKPWTRPFIERKVLPFLSMELGQEWRNFILQLPGWPQSVVVQSRIERKIEEETSVLNRITGCLMEWMRSADQQLVCKDSIVRTLQAVERGELVEKLEDLTSGSSEALDNEH